MTNGTQHARPTAPLPPAALHAITRLERAFDPTNKVRAALGLPNTWRPSTHADETATRFTMWSQLELNDLYEHVGGTLTARTVQRSSSDGTTWAATEITVTKTVPGVGPVSVSTDWYEEYGGRDLPLMRALPAGLVLAVTP